MRNRWSILAILFVVRSTIAFQFQSVAAVAPLLEKTFGVSLADIGILIGLFFTPGIVLALPGGAIGRRFGDKPTTIAALLLMSAGSLVMAVSDIWSLQLAGRLASGAGGVLLTVQLTKMGADWFAGKEIATARLHDAGTGGGRAACQIGRERRGRARRRRSGRARLPATDVAFRTHHRGP